MRVFSRALAAHPWLGWLAAFVAAVAVFVYVQPASMFADPDTFYHARLTQMLRDQGLVTDFPWTTASLYREVFIDHHLGYHLLALPIMSLWDDPLVGMRFATVLFAVLSVMAVIFLLRRWQCPWWGAGLLLLLTTAPFVFRLSLVKAPSLAIGVAVIAYWLVAERRLGWLFIYAWFWAWFYSSWPLLVVMAGAVVLAGAFRRRQGAAAVVRRVFGQDNLKLAAVVVGGIACGLVVNPYFPENLAYLSQLLSMALTPYHKFIGIGGEWYPYHPADLPAYLAYPILAWLVSTVAAVFTLRQQTDLSRASWLLAVFFFAYTFRARRQAEYLTPWLVLSSGLMLRDAGAGRLAVTQLWKRFQDWVPQWMRRKAVAGVILGYIVIVVPWGLAHGVMSVKRGLDYGFSRGTLAGTAGWLEQHSQSGDIVFQSDWGTFPMLWYHNRENLYLTGLDQTFMYEYDRELYRAWKSLTGGERRDVSSVARDQFGARYLLVEKRTPAMLVWANRDRGLFKVYEDIEAIVYEVSAQ